MPLIDALRLWNGRRLVRAVLALAALAVDLWVWGGHTTTWNGGQTDRTLIIALAVLGYSCLALWRSPVPGYLALWLLSFGGLLVPSIQGVAGYLVALFLMAWRTPRQVAVMALVGSAVPVAVNTAAVWLLSNAGTHALGVHAGGCTLLMVSVWLVGRLLACRDRQLAAQHRQIEDDQVEALVAERLRISREIHDTVAHSLTGIVLRAAGARAGLARDAATKDELDRALGSIQGAGEQSMRELHRLLGMLRQTDKAEMRGGIEQLGDLVQSARAAGLDVVCQGSGEPVELDPSIAHTGYRVVQEGLSNVMKHAGAGTRVEVVLDWLPESLAITVRNAAGVRPPAAPSGGFGLVGLRERVSVIGGTLRSGPTPQGYLLHADLPTSRTRPAPAEGES
ncbi:MAG: histidine kinase [Propioniciclava sp.]|uniref:sensor histidine kinase n=1 Tax=Propioniciclava sp. TaxID=2038686 RepID=UPI0039E68EF8